MLLASGAILEFMFWDFDDDAYGYVDDYRVYKSSVLALSASRIVDLGAAGSSSAFLRLPSELREAILVLLDRSALLALTLASRHCCQLAHTELFKQVTLQYSHKSSSLMLHVLSEVADRLDGKAKLNELSANVRYLTLATEPKWITLRHGIDISVVDLDQTERERRLTEATQGYEEYVNIVERSLCAGAFLNLHTIKWRDPIASSKSSFDALAQSGIEHLILPQIEVVEDFELTIPQSVNGGQWPLKTLYLGLTQSNLAKEKLDLGLLTSSILRSCAETIEAFSSTMHTFLNARHSFPLDRPGCQFPRLR